MYIQRLRFPDIVFYIYSYIKYINMDIYLCRRFLMNLHNVSEERHQFLWITPGYALLLSAIKQKAKQ